MGSAGHGLYMADLISTNSTSSSSSKAAGAGKGSASFSPAVIAIVGVLGTAFLLVSYYTMVAKFCRGRRRGWARRRLNGLNEEEHGLQATWPVAAHLQEQGLEEAEIEAIPVVEFFRRDRSEDCAVCLSEFREAERVRLLPSCCHAFHLPCIDVWLRSHASCPLCRTPILLHHPDDPDPSGPRSPLFLRAGSSHTSSPLDAATAYRLPNSGDENMQSPPSSTQKLWPLQPEQFLRRGNLSMKSPINKQLDLLLATQGGREDFPFGRCFSTGRSRGFLNKAFLHPDDAQQHSMSTTPKHTHIGMQRSSSYHVGSILKRDSPNDHMCSSLSRAFAVASFLPPPFVGNNQCGQVSRDCESGQIMQDTVDFRSKSLNHTQVKRVANHAFQYACQHTEYSGSNLQSSRDSSNNTVDL